MEPERRVHIVVLYLHPLLGEGLASLLSAQAGVTATAIARRDQPAASAALAGEPDLVVVEGADVDDAQRQGSRSPTAFFTTMDRHGQLLGPRLSDPDDVLALARDLLSRVAVGAGRG